MANAQIPDADPTAARIVFEIAQRLGDFQHHHLSHRRSGNMIAARAAAGIVCACLCLASPRAIADVLYVNGACGDDAWSGLSPDCVEPDGPKRSIRAGMSAARNGDTVLVADGVYREGGLSFPGGENFAVRSQNGPENCIIDGQDRGLAFWFVVDETPDAVIEGFTVTNGRGEWGGAVYCHHDGAPTFINCAFINNTAGWGGAIGCDTAGSPTFIDCLFEGNTATRGGGGAIIGDTDGPGPNLINCTFRNNSAVTNGGAVSIRSVGSRPMLINCTIVDNSAGGNGGGVYSGGFRSGDLLINCTVAGNTADGLGGGVFVDNGDGPVSVANSILWGNSGAQIVGDAAAVTYSDVQGGFNGSGNIDVDPLFVDPGNGDYHLRPGSPGIDAADNTAVPQEIETDLDGNPRFVDDPATKDTGEGDPPIVDMGAYEFQGSGCDPCDTNCDGSVDLTDVEPFIELLLEGGKPCSACAGDANSDGSIDLSDVEGFIGCLLG